MTNEEEAIEQLNHMKVFIGYDAESPMVKEMQSALDIAIKALEQHPSDNNWKFYYDHGYAQAKRDLLCEDCISREETIEWLKKVTVTDGITFKTGFEQILYDIEQMPSVTPKAESEGEE